MHVHRWLLVLALMSLGVGLAASRKGEAPRTVATVSHPKRGIASARYLQIEPEVLSQLGAAWAYNWGPTPPPGPSPEWVPMVWGSGAVTRATIASLTAARSAGRARYLLGFNEPDSTTEANMTPARAAALWPQLQRTGLKLGSPAPSVATGGWLAKFMAIVRRRHLRVDFLALHYYQDFTNPDAVGELKRQLIALHDRYHKPIWITEVGAFDTRSWGEPMLHRPTDALASSYMRKLFAMLDRMPFVQRYAWFTDDCWSERICRYGSLVDASGRLTPAGRAFETAN